jgi:hypothetical protein
MLEFKVWKLCAEIKKISPLGVFFAFTTSWTPCFEVGCPMDAN